jgi:hypothetical protein
MDASFQQIISTRELSTHLHRPTLAVRAVAVILVMICFVQTMEKILLRMDLDDRNEAQLINPIWRSARLQMQCMDECTLQLEGEVNEKTIAALSASYLPSARHIRFGNFQLMFELINSMANIQSVEVVGEGNDIGHYVAAPDATVQQSTSTGHVKTDLNDDSVATN